MCHVIRLCRRPVVTKLQARFRFGCFGFEQAAICNMPTQRPAEGYQIIRPAANRMCLLCQIWFVSCFAVCSCTKQTDVMSSVTSLAGGERREQCAMCSGCVKWDASCLSNWMLAFTLGALALKQLLLACCLCLFLNCAPLVLSESAAWCSPILVAAVVALTLHRLVVRHCACVPVPSRCSCAFLCTVQSCVTSSRPTWCRLSPHWPGVRDDASTKQCAMCSGCAKWEASCHQTACSLSLWVRRLWNLVTHTTWSHTIFHTHNFVTRIFQTQLYHTQLFTYNFFLTYRCSTTSFVFPFFPVPLQLLFLLIGRSWFVGFSGPLISPTAKIPKQKAG